MFATFDKDSSFQTWHVNPSEYIIEVLNVIKFVDVGTVLAP